MLWLTPVQQLIDERNPSLNCGGHLSDDKRYIKMGFELWSKCYAYFAALLYVRLTSSIYKIKQLS